MNHHLDELEKVRQEMQDGYPNKDYYSAEDLENSGKVVFWITVGIVLLVLGMFFYAGYKAASFSQLQEFLNGTSTVSNLSCSSGLSHGPQKKTP